MHQIESFCTCPILFICFMVVVSRTVFAYSSGLTIVVYAADFAGFARSQES